MLSRLYPLVLIAISIVIILFSFNIIALNEIYYIVSIIIVVIIVSTSALSKKVKTKIREIMVKNNVFTVNAENKTITGVAARLVGKQEADKAQVDVQRELNNLLGALLSRSKANGVKYVIVTSVSGKQASSSIIVFKECENCVEEVAKEFQYVAEIASVVAPHVSLEPVSVTTESIPLPRSFGNVTFARITDLKVDSPVAMDRLVVNYDVEIGEMVVRNQAVPVGIMASDVLRHIGIFGSTGSGKSNTASLLAKELINKGFNVLILDWHGEYRQKLPEFTVFDQGNVFKLNPLKFNDIDDTIEILSDVLQLTDPQRFLLFVLVSKVKKSEGSLSDLFNLLKNVNDQSNWIKEVKYALARKLYPLFTAKGKTLFNADQNPDLNSLLSLNGVIFDLSFINNLRLRRLYGLFVMKLVSDYYMAGRANRKLLILVEEAQNYFQAENEFIDKLISEVRKFGIGLCIVSQSPSSISPNVMKNTNVKIVHAIKSDIDKRILGESMSLPSNMYSVMDKLDVGEAILSAPNIKIPILIKIKKI